MNSTIFHGLEPYLLHWEEDLSLDMSMVLYRRLQPHLLHLSHGCVKINWLCPGYLILWSVELLKFSVIQSHPCIYGIKLRKCMGIKTTLLVFFSLRKTLQICNKKASRLFNTLAA
ncbi:hypothetical protein ACFX11_007486 [Malus domestica]